MQMEWSKTKTIFILAFLILDLYLAYSFYEMRSDSIVEPMVETTTEEDLQLAGITYSKLPESQEKGFYITAKSKEFTAEEIAKLKDQSQRSTIGESSITTLYMDLDKPFPLPDVNAEVKADQFVKNNVLYGELYHYWYSDEKSNTMIYIQEYKDNKIFQELDEHIAMVILNLNEKNEIVSYNQSMLEDIKEVQEKEVTVSPLEAIGVLYTKNLLQMNSKIVEVDYGYYTNIPLSNQQILAPTWHLIVETNQGERKDYYVNALAGEVLQSSEKSIRSE
ncbi:hypothetical protein CHH83_19390 [Bacillus sp. 7586-K]|nr:hypothetical protein CHH83_19390 [Bacillus sp. 7586-K]